MCQGVILAPTPRRPRVATLVYVVVASALVLAVAISAYVNVRAAYSKRLAQRSEEQWWVQQCQSEDFQQRLQWRCMRVSPELAAESDTAALLAAVAELCDWSPALVWLMQIVDAINKLVAGAVCVALTVLVVYLARVAMQRQRARSLRQWRPIL